MACSACGVGARGEGALALELPPREHQSMRINFWATWVWMRGSRCGVFGLRSRNSLFAFVPLLLAFVDLGGRDTQDPLEVVEGSETRACRCAQSNEHCQEMQAGSSVAIWE